MNEQEKEKGTSLKVINKISELMTAALSLIAALAWNDAIQSLFNEIFGKQSTIIAKFFYAILITALTVWLALRLTKMAKSAEKTVEKLEDKINGTIKTLRE